MIIKHITFIWFILFFFSIPSESQSLEYSVKAIYLEKFARFTDWPDNISGENFIIAVLGKSPFDGELEKLAKKTKIKNKPLKINYLNEISELSNCQLLFISSSEKDRLSEVLQKVEYQNILTIADMPGACKKGVHINLYTDGSGTVHYEINPEALKKAKLTVEMQLLSYGKIIN